VLPPRLSSWQESSTVSSATATARQYADDRPSVDIDQVAPPSVVIARPPSPQAATTVLGCPGTTKIWCTSTFMSTVRCQVEPPSVLRPTPPTWMLTQIVSSSPMSIDRTDAGAPHGVIHCSWPGIASKVGMRLNPSSVNRNSAAGSVPSQTSAPSTSRQVARPSLNDSYGEAPSSSTSQICP
jgi:hypothetical protein